MTGTLTLAGMVCSWTLPEPIFTSSYKYKYLLTKTFYKSRVYKKAPYNRQQSEQDVNIEDGEDRNFDSIASEKLMTLEVIKIYGWPESADTQRKSRTLFLVNK